MTLSKDARARAVQLPAWNEALGLSRPWDQQWSMRMQQILAYETNLLECPTFSKARRPSKQGRRAEGRREGRVGSHRSRRSRRGHRRHEGALVESNTERLRGIESGEQVVVGVNCWTETEAVAAPGPVDTVRYRRPRSRRSRSSDWRPGARLGTAMPSNALAELERADKEGSTSWSRRSRVRRRGTTASGADAARRVRRVSRADRRIACHAGAR